MDVPPHIMIDGSINNPSVRAIVEQEIDKLEQFYPHLVKAAAAMSLLRSGNRDPT